MTLAFRTAFLRFVRFFGMKRGGSRSLKSATWVKPVINKPKTAPRRPYLFFGCLLLPRLFVQCSFLSDFFARPKYHRPVVIVRFLRYSG